MPEYDSTIQYREVPGFPGYMVGNDGSVWSCWKKVCLGGRMGSKSILGHQWHLMTACPNWQGRLRVILVPGPRKCQVARLVLLAFVGPCPEGMECCHNDGDMKNNSLNNLRWDTRESNIADRHKHGGYNNRPNGRQCPMAKLTEEQVRSIRSEYVPRKVTYKKLALKYGVSQITIHDVIHRVVWKHVV